MENNNYKILVLSDLGNSASTTLKSAVSLAKMINGQIDLFYVKKPADIIDKDSQLSAMRTINTAYNNAAKKVQNLITPISQEHNIKINSSFSFGNVKNEIENYIKERNPDIIVLGKRKVRPLRLIRNNITNFVLKNHKGVIMITDENGLEPNKALSLGLLNVTESSFNLDFADYLLEHHTQESLQSFKVIKNPNEIKEFSVIKKGKKIIEHVFEQNSDALKKVSNHLLKDNINLLCLNRGGNNHKDRLNLTESRIKEVINKLNVSLLVTGEIKLNSKQNTN